MRTEKDIRREICEYLDTFPQCIFRINHEDRRRMKSKYLPKGWPDISGSFGSRAMYFEVKTPDGTIRQDQVKFMDRARAQGAICGFVTSVDDVREALS